MSHTETPWEILWRSSERKVDGAIIFHEGTDATVARTWLTSSLETMTANTEFIVRACNAFDALLEACETALEALYNVPEVGEEYDQQHSGTHMLATLALTDAIAKAKGRE